MSYTCNHVLYICRIALVKLVHNLLPMPTHAEVFKRRENVQSFVYFDVKVNIFSQYILTDLLVDSQAYDMYPLKSV